MEGEKASGIVVSSKFTWKIPNFSQLPETKIYSEIFVVGDCKWRLLIYPKGNNKVDELSIYLDVADSKDLPDGWNRDVEFSFSVINHNHKTATVTEEFQNVFSAKQSDWGYPSFIPLRELKDPAKGYLVKDTLTVEAEVHVLSSVHSSKDSKKDVIEVEAIQAPEPAGEALPNQTHSAVYKEKDIGDIEEKGDTHVQTTSKYLLSELSHRRKKLKPISSDEILDSTKASDSTIFQREQKKALREYVSMSLEAIQQADCFVKIEEILHKLVQLTDDLQEKTIFGDIKSRMAEFESSINNAKAISVTAQTRRSSLAEKIEDHNSKLEQRQKELSTLESEFSTLSDEEAKLRAEIDGVVSQKKSVSVKLKKVSEETCKEIEECKKLEAELKQVNVEWYGAKEKLASANVFLGSFKGGFGSCSVAITC